MLVRTGNASSERESRRTRIPSNTCPFARGMYHQNANQTHQNGLSHLSEHQPDCQSSLIGKYIGVTHPDRVEITLTSPRLARFKMRRSARGARRGATAAAAGRGPPNPSQQQRTAQQAAAEAVPAEAAAAAPERIGCAPDVWAAMSQRARRRYRHKQRIILGERPQVHCNMIIPRDEWSQISRSTKRRLHKKYYVTVGELACSRASLCCFHCLHDRVLCSMSLPRALTLGILVLGGLQVKQKMHCSRRLPRS